MLVYIDADADVYEDDANDVDFEGQNGQKLWKFLKYYGQTKIFKTQI